MKINLLKVRVSRFTKADKLRRYNKIMIAVAGGVLGILIIALIAQIGYFSLQNTSLAQRVRTLEAEYSQRSEEAVKYKRIKEVIAQVSTVLKSRYPYREMVLGAYKVLPPGVVVTAASFSDRGLMNFSGKAPGVVMYSEFLKLLTASSTNPDFMYENVLQFSLGRAPIGDYRFSLGLETRK